MYPSVPPRCALMTAKKKKSPQTVASFKAGVAIDSPTVSRAQTRVIWEGEKTP